jgi:hypothetical protein
MERMGWNDERSVVRFKQMNSYDLDVLCNILSAPEEKPFRGKT